MRQLSVSRPGCLVMLSSLSSALWMLRRIEGGGQQLRWQLWSSRHCPWWKEGTARELKDVGVMFAMKEYCAVTTPHWEPFIRHNDFTILWSRFLIWKVCTEWSLIWWSPIIPIVHWAVIPDVRITITRPLSRCHAPPDDGAVDWVFRMHGCGRGLGLSLIMFYRVTSQLGLSEPSHSICSQALSYVTAPPPSFSSDSTLTTGCGFLWKTNSTIFQLELAKILALCKFCH